MKKLSRFLDSEDFLLLTVIVLIGALLVHTTVVFYSFSVVEDPYLRLATSLMFSLPIALLVMVFTLHKSNQKEWEFDASGWLAVGTALIFILYMKPWQDFTMALWQNSALKFIAGSMIGIGEYALPRLYVRLRNRADYALYKCPWTGRIFEHEKEFKAYLAGKIGQQKKVTKIK